MWWETVLVALIPSLVTMIVTNWFSKRKYQAEVKTTESQNMQTILETYKLTLDQYKQEIEDVNRRFSTYIEQANHRAEVNKNKIESLEKSNAELKRKIDKLIEEACLTKGCSKRTYFKD